MKRFSCVSSHLYTYTYHTHALMTSQSALVVTNVLLFFFFGLYTDIYIYIHIYIQIHITIDETSELNIYSFTLYCCVPAAASTRRRVYASTAASTASDLRIMDTKSIEPSSSLGISRSLFDIAGR